MAHALLVLCTLLGTLQNAAGLFDSAYYKILSDPRGETFSYYAEKCIGEANVKILNDNLVNVNYREDAGKM